MKVNESTYETYFLLYVDNELTATEKSAVDAFVIANPSYATILHQLQQTKLIVAEEVYEDKALLYKFDEMEASVDMPFKQTLYRTETKLIKPNFTKKYYAFAMSAAAILVLLLGYQFFQHNEKVIIKGANSGLAKLSQKNNSHTPNEAINKQELVSVPNNVTDIIAKTEAKKQIQGTDNINKELLNTSLVQEVNTSISKIRSNPKEESNSLMEAAILHEPLEIAKNHSATISLASNTELQIEAINNKEQVAYNEVEYNEINTSENERTIYISSFEIDSDKFRGITRRVNAFFKRNKSDKE